MQLAESSEWIKGLIERVTFHSEESGFCVLRVKVNGKRDLQTVIGNAPCIQAGEFIEARGFWLNDKQHGLQFKTDYLKTIIPTTVEGIEKYLASGMVKGIGVGFAQRLVRAFKETVFEVIEGAPHRLAEVEGIGAKRQESIVKAWAEQCKIRDIMMFLHSYGVGTARAVRIYKTYGDNAVSLVQENPYRLAHDIYGIGFKTADQLAQRLGIAKDSILRIRAGVTHCLQKVTSIGHCGAQQEDLIASASLALEVSEELIIKAIHDEQANDRITMVTLENKNYYFLTSLYLAEKNIAALCKKLKENQTSWTSIDSDRAIEWVEKKTSIILSDSQRLAVKGALSHKVFIVTGGPGVGKTTIVNSIIKIIATQKVRLLLAAPTGRAAKRLSESTHLEAKTIHRLLEYDPKTHQFKRNAQNPLETDFLVIDETSMVDVVLMNQLLRALPQNAALLMVGDVDQLPSVGPGMVLKDLIDSKTIPTARLTEIFRQAATSKIITNAHRINQGKIPIGGEKSDKSLSDFYLITCNEVEKIKAKVLTLVTKKIPQTFDVASQNIQVLAPTKRGPLGTLSLNSELQKQLNPQTEVITKFGTTFGVNDKVIQVVNNYDKDVFNGDIGTICELDVEQKVVWIAFDGKRVEYEFSELDEIQLAYATTIHKSQGSEYPAVIIPLSMQHYMLLERNLFYTGVTRGKKLVVVVGQTKAIVLATKQIQAQNRITSLKEWLE